jgi:hypothetical protein
MALSFFNFQLKEKEPVVQSVLNAEGNGVILDLSKYGNSNITNLQDTLKEALNKTLNPTTLTLQEVNVFLFPVVVSVLYFIGNVLSVIGAKNELGK